MYDEAKTAQMAAFFLKKGGSEMRYIKVIKLLYLAEREHLAVYHSPMTGDFLSSMNNGPILSITYNCIKNEAGSKDRSWKKWIEDKKGYFISLKNKINSVEELDELSESDIEILNKIWDEFGEMSWTDIIQYTHDNCPEWKHPHGSSNPIEYSDIFKALDFPPEQIANIQASIEENNHCRKFLSVG